jgi:FtsZ-binding cell division protein ZapB
MASYTNQQFSRIQSLERETENLKRDNESLKRDNENLKRENQNFQQKIQSLNRENVVVKSENINLTRFNQDLEMKLQKEISEKQHSKNVLVQTENENRRYVAEVSRLTSENSRLYQNATRAVCQRCTMRC